MRVVSAFIRKPLMTADTTQMNADNINDLFDCCFISALIRVEIRVNPRLIKNRFNFWCWNF